MFAAIVDLLSEALIHIWALLLFEP